MFCLILLLAGPCEIQNLRVYHDYSNSIRIAWECDQPNNDFEIAYQLVNAGICGTKNTTNMSSIHLPYLQHQFQCYYNQYKYDSYNYGSLNHDYYNYCDLYINFNHNANMYANSTYLFTVQAKQWQPGNEIVYGPQHDGVHYTTSKGKLY